jgi:hypothetical protein
MNATQWNNCTDPLLMLDSIGEQMSDRQLKQFTVACCRQIKQIPEEAEDAVKVIEAEANGYFDPNARDRVCNSLVLDLIEPSSSATVGGLINGCMLEILSQESSLKGARSAISLATRAASWNLTNTSSQKPSSTIESEHDLKIAELTVLAQLLRELVGNSFMR